jgi:hypothetical protein
MEQTGQASDPLSEAGQHAGESVGQMAERAADIGFRQADRGKDQAAQGLTQVASTIRRVGGEMEGEQPAIANISETVADQAERIATYLQTTDAREIVHTIESTARRQPLLFVGGAFLIGLAASRLLKAATGGNQASSAYSDGYRPMTYGTSGLAGTSDAYRATGPGGRSSLDELPGEGI